MNMTGSDGLLMRRIAVASVAVATTLTLLKAGAFIYTNSMAMLASLMDSALDIFASVINLLAVRHALTPADSDHRFGHGKAEPLAGLAQSAFIAGSSMVMVIGSIERLIEPRPVEHGDAGLIVMAVSIVATFALVTVQGMVVRRTQSVAISADRMHYLADLLTNVGVVLAIVLATDFGLLVADPLIGILVACVLAGGSWQVFRRSYDQLMDREMPSAAREQIKTIIKAHPAVKGMHDLRTREAGTKAFVQVHVEFDPAESLLAVHAASDQIDDALQAAFPHAEIIIHHDPAGLEAVPPLAQT
jgi:ferrous-iron efflux pump FieF